MSSHTSLSDHSVVHFSYLFVSYLSEHYVRISEQRCLMLVTYRY